MMGAATGQQDRLFYEFNLEDMVPADHLLRRIDAVLDLSWLRGELASHYSAIGRPSICPELMILTTTGRVFAGNTLYYRSSKPDCDPCPLKDRCCPKAPARRIPRDVNEAARDHARALRGTEAFRQSARKRKEDRNPVRRREVEPRPHPAQIAGPDRRAGRVPSCRHHPEPQAAGEAHCHSTAQTAIRVIRC